MTRSESSLALPLERKSKVPHVLLWVGQVALALMFGMAGLTKATQPIAELATQMKWASEIPELMVRFIGTVEFLGAVGLVLPSALRIAPKLTPLAGAGLAVVMLLASLHHLRMGDGAGPMTINAVLGALALAVAWGRWRVAPILPR